MRVGQDVPNLSNQLDDCSVKYKRRLQGHIEPYQGLPLPDLLLAPPHVYLVARNPPERSKIVPLGCLGECVLLAAVSRREDAKSGRISSHKGVECLLRQSHWPTKVLRVPLGRQEAIQRGLLGAQRLGRGGCG